jgi:CRISPR-associated protein Cmr6
MKFKPKIYAAADTLAVWNALPSVERSRSLAADRFLDFPNPPARDGKGKSVDDDDWRRRSCLAIQSAGSNLSKVRHWADFLEKLGLKCGEVLWGRLQAHLIINAAGGVLENGGMCLDHFSGVPFIPGSAVKGCARQYAILELTDAAREQKEKLLPQIALVFGWGADDWSDRESGKGQFVSDFKTACGKDWNALREASAKLLFERFGWKADLKKELWLQLPSFTGSLNFLPAYPKDDPGIDLDVITCHHPDYYGQTKDKQGNLIRAVALDDENPKPIVFPAVSAAKQTEFAFAVIKSRNGTEDLLHAARRWLKTGLEQLGVGGKTSAGYGWFSCSPASTQTDRATRAVAAAAPVSQVSAVHPLITEWKGKTSRENFRAFRTKLAAISDTNELRLVFMAIMPPAELANRRRRNPYWQSFVGHPEGQTILQRLGIILQ